MFAGSMDRVAPYRHSESAYPTETSPERGVIRYNGTTSVSGLDYF